VLCMLKRNEHASLPTLRSYLSMKFPEIPSDMREPIIIAAYTAAQKVAATHIDYHLPETENRARSAKVSLARWLHGLGTLEPSSNYVMPRSAEEPTDPNAYSPTNNCLEDRQLPVPLDSQYKINEARRAFDLATEQTVATQVSVANQGNVSLSVSDTLARAAGKLLQSGTSQQGVLGAEVMEQPQMQGSVEPMDIVLATSGAVSTVTSVAPGLVVTAASDLADFLPMGDDRPNEKVMEDGEVTDSPATTTESDGMAATFLDLLRVETDDLALMEDLTRPLLDVVTPVRSPIRVPEKQQSELERSDHTVGAQAEQPVLKSIVNQGGNLESNENEIPACDLTKIGKSPKKPKIDRPRKENVQPKESEKSKNDKARSRGSDSGGRKKLERHDAGGRKRENSGSREVEDEDDEPLRPQRVPDFKIPHRPPQHGYRGSSVRYSTPRDRGEYGHGRSIGFGRGYRYSEMDRRENYNRPYSPPIPRSVRIPGLTAKQQQWMDQIPRETITWSEQH